MEAQTVLLGHQCLPVPKAGYQDDMLQSVQGWSGSLAEPQTQQTAPTKRLVEPAAFCQLCSAVHKL